MAARFRNRPPWFGGFDDFHGRHDVRMHAHQRVTLGRIHQLVHQPQARHGVLGVTDRFTVGRRDLVDGEFFRQRGAAHE